MAMLRQQQSARGPRDAPGAGAEWDAGALPKAGSSGGGLLRRSSTLTERAHGSGSKGIPLSTLGRKQAVHYTVVVSELWACGECRCVRLGVLLGPSCAGSG